MELLFTPNPFSITTFTLYFPAHTRSQSFNSTQFTPFNLPSHPFIQAATTMKFTTIATILALAVSVTAGTQTCTRAENCKRSMSLTSKPREWINAVRSLTAETLVEVEVVAKE